MTQWTPAVALALLLGLASRSGLAATPATSPPVAALAPGSSLAEVSASFEKIAERVGPAVVQIYVSGYGVGSDAGGLLTKERGTGSGVVIDPEGLVVTNAHVVAGARRIQIQLAGWTKAVAAQPPVLKPEGGRLEAQVVGLDETTDLALLRISAHHLPTLEFADSDTLRQGQLVLAFGSPLGLGNTVTMGIVSAVARQLHEDDALAFVQTDAPINPGNSGGPLVDASGKVVGINTLIVSQSGGSEGVGLAIPSNTVRAIVEQLRAQGRVRRGVIGIQVQTVTAPMAAALKLPVAWGVIVSDLLPDGPAAKTGLKIGDVILAADGKPVENLEQFGTNLYRHAIDAKVALDILRGHERLTLRVPVIERQDDPTRFAQLVNPEKNLVPQLDLLGIDVTPEVAANLNHPRIESGVLVAALSSEAASSGDRFRPGDIIHGVNGAAIESLVQLRVAVAGLKDGDAVVVQIERQGLLMFVAFEID